jgi:hypothetical protein
MVGTSKLSRRGILQGGAALGVMGMAGLAAAPASAAPASKLRLPARANLVIRNA